jgi:uncharacterized protein
MYTSGSSLTLSATDLSAFSECAHKTTLELQVAFGQLERPGVNELERRLLEKRGFDHEARVLAHFRESGRSVVTIGLAPGKGDEGRSNAAAATEAAMAAGADVIYQGVLFDGEWLGRPDFLLKSSGKSRFGEHQYAVLDAKLARETKARAVLQLCVYTDHLARVQGALPEYCFIAPGGDEVRLTRLRTADYLAYYRLAKARLQAFVQASGAESYPEPVEHCDVCGWWKRCEMRRRADDHLSLVAGITTRQRDRLAVAGVTRVTELGALEADVRVAGISDVALGRVREQARLQVLGRGAPQPVYELLLDAEPGTGLEALPMPKPGDLFLDLEGDAFVQDQGLEYLFGLLELGEPLDDIFSSREAPGAPRYKAYWARDRAEEKRAFEAVIDRIVKGRAEFRDLHVFHFGHRESDALKHLSCRHHTREEAVDELLRDHVLVDLHAVVRRSVRASVEGYTLKQLEGLHGFERRTELRAAAHAMQWFGWLLETGEGRASERELMETIERYNEEDCLSTCKLRDWLEARRPELARATGRSLGRPSGGAESKPERAPSEAALVAASLIAGLPADPADDTPEHTARRLLANLLDWHWREAKSGHWECFRTEELPADERLEDRTALASLSFAAELRTEKRSKVYRYDFPEQEHGIRKVPGAIDPATRKSAGEVVEIGSSHIDLKRSASGAPHPTDLIPARPIETKAHAARLLTIARSIISDGLEARDTFAAARDLLQRTLPRAGQEPGQPLVLPGADTVLAIKRLALALDRSVLAVQGPPGSGKTYRAAEMIVALVRAGKRVGITANSHEVIRTLLSKAVELSQSAGAPLRAVHFGNEQHREAWGEVPFELVKDHAEVRKRLDAGQIDLIGGTAWAWVTEHFQQSLDVLVVDEAGQMSLANVLAVSPAASSLVLFGDPAQLDQPQKGVHPPGADRSALEHLLGDALTMPPERGVFLSETRRLHPAICAFTSRVFYEDRLASLPELAAQRVEGPEPFNGSGLRFVPVVARGNTNRSEEEVERIAELVDELLRSGARFHDYRGSVRPLTAKDVLVVAPYNAQVAALKRRLPAAMAVGTVDKFQGKEAPIVIYSMTSASAEDAPRGLEFLYSLNRFNVATSRAQALVVLVASPELSRVRCKSPRQMQLANALCTYLELSLSGGACGGVR